jgi:hypothetical protein
MKKNPKSKRPEVQNENRASVPTAYLEQSARYAVERSHETEKINTPACIHLHSKRHRETDADGACAKWVIDAIVACGLLFDDSPTFVKEVSYSQEKVAKSESEVTIVTIS